MTDKHIDAEPEVESGVNLQLQIAPTVLLSKDFLGINKSDGVLIQSWLNSAYEKIDEMYKQPSAAPSADNLIAELVEALEESVERSFNPFEPDNQHRYYHKWVALLKRAKEAIK